MKILRLVLFVCILCISFGLKAQIGYQVALINSATGEPRALESVSVNVIITDSKGQTILNSYYNETSNEFGIINLTVGDSNTFDRVDWNYLPFFISASVDGKLLSKTQILNVPVAEYAKKTGRLTTEILKSKTWNGEINYENQTIKAKFNFGDNGGNYIIESIYNIGSSSKREISFSYYIFGNVISISNFGIGLYNPDNNTIQMAYDEPFLLK